MTNTNRYDVRRSTGFSMKLCTIFAIFATMTAFGCDSIADYGPESIESAMFNDWYPGPHPNVHWVYRWEVDSPMFRSVSDPPQFQIYEDPAIPGSFHEGNRGSWILEKGLDCWRDHIPSMLSAITMWDHSGSLISEMGFRSTGSNQERMNWVLEPDFDAAAGTFTGYIMPHYSIWDSQVDVPDCQAQLENLKIDPFEIPVTLHFVHWERSLSVMSRFSFWPWEYPAVVLNPNAP